jgi:hypothetical protein
MVDFAAMASLRDEDLPVARKLPMGTYIWSVDRIPAQEPSTKGGGLNVKVRLKCVGAIEDFEDPEALEEYGNVAGAVRTKTFYYPEQASSYPKMDEAEFADWQARAGNEIHNFFANILQIEGESTTERLSNAVGHQCLGTIVYKPDRQNPSGPLREEFSGFAPLVEG